MATLKTNQLDINLGRIADQGTREALQSIVSFVNEMTQKIRTNKEVKAGRLVNTNETAGIEKDGTLYAKSLELDSGGAFKVMVVSGEITTLDSRVIQLTEGTRILGAFGWSQNDTSANWWPILDYNTSTTVPIANDIYIGGATLDSITLNSADGNSTNKFNLVIFYVDR